MSKIDTDEILHKLRNPWGLSKDEIRGVRLAAANEIDRLREELKMVRRDQEKLSNSQIDVVEVIESLERDVLGRCKDARSLILFNENPKAIEQRTKDACFKAMYAYLNEHTEGPRTYAHWTYDGIKHAIDSAGEKDEQD